MDLGVKAVKEEDDIVCSAVLCSVYVNTLYVPVTVTGVPKVYVYQDIVT